jgi:hypothetical protein
MHSRSLIEKTLLSTININKKNTSFADFYIDMKDLRKDWLNNDKFKHLTKIYFPINANRSNFSFYQDSILSTIYNSIIKDHLSIVNKDKKNSIVTVEIKSKNEYFSKYFCESLVKNVSDFYIITKSKKASTNLDILQMQADSLKKELNHEVSSVSYSTDNIFNINPSKSFKKISITNHQINVQINTIILTQLLTNLEIAKINLRKETPLFQIIDTPIFPLKKEKSSKLYALIFGGLLGGFLSTLFFIFLRIWRNIMVS